MDRHREVVEHVFHEEVPKYIALVEERDCLDTATCLEEHD